MGKAYLPPEALGRVHSEALAFHWVKEVVRKGRQVVKSCLPVPIVGWNVKAWIVLRISFLCWWPLLSNQSCGSISLYKVLKVA
jgi:hypothetical protein